jgi:hypothetical protein
MVVGFTTTYAISAYHHWIRISIRARCTSLCDKVCQWLATGRWFSPGTPVSSTNNTDRHDITEILLKVALNTINQSINHICTLKLLQMHIKHKNNVRLVSKLQHVILRNIYVTELFRAYWNYFSEKWFTGGM